MRRSISDVPDFAARVYRLVRAVPYGKVVSYGGVAALLGRPRAARAVGSALRALPDDSAVPWWRVINRNGEISIRGDHGPALQRALLEAEGVRFDRAGRTDWRRFGWDGRTAVQRRAARSGAAGSGTPRERDLQSRERRHGRNQRRARIIARSAAIAVRHPRDPSLLLVVRRPPDDDDLPNLWGLPAASRQPRESWAACARRIGRDKLGVSLGIGAELNRGSARRAERTLEMRLFEAWIEAGRPSVPQSVTGVTQYTDWKWTDAVILHYAADRGSLCCRLYLERQGTERRTVRV